MSHLDLFKEQQREIFSESRIMKPFPQDSHEYGNRNGRQYGVSFSIPPPVRNSSANGTTQCKVPTQRESSVAHIQLKDSVRRSSHAASFSRGRMPPSLREDQSKKLLLGGSISVSKEEPLEMSQLSHGSSFSAKSTSNWGTGQRMGPVASFNQDSSHSSSHFSYASGVHQPSLASSLRYADNQSLKPVHTRTQAQSIKSKFLPITGRNPGSSSAKSVCSIKYDPTNETRTQASVAPLDGSIPKDQSNFELTKAKSEALAELLAQKLSAKEELKSYVSKHLSTINCSTESSLKEIEEKKNLSIKELKKTQNESQALIKTLEEKKSVIVSFLSKLSSGIDEAKGILDQAIKTIDSGSKTLTMIQNASSDLRLSSLYDRVTNIVDQYLKVKHPQLLRQSDKVAKKDEGLPKEIRIDTGKCPIPSKPGGTEKKRKSLEENRQSKKKKLKDHSSRFLPLQTLRSSSPKVETQNLVETSDLPSSKPPSKSAGKSKTKAASDLLFQSPSPSCKTKCVTPLELGDSSEMSSFLFLSPIRASQTSKSDLKRNRNRSKAIRSTFGKSISNFVSDDGFDFLSQDD